MVRPTNKLVPKLDRRFKISAKIDNNAYRLEVQNHWCIRNVFHTLLLEVFETIRSKDDHKFDQNLKQLRAKRNTKWNRFYKVKSRQLAERLLEEIRNFEPYMSWLNGRAIQIMSLHENQEWAWNTQWNPLKSSINNILIHQPWRLEDKSGGEERHLLWILEYTTITVRRKDHVTTIQCKSRDIRNKPVVHREQ
jgi:hypothetical protein